MSATLPGPVAFVFGGGAASTASQVGMLDAALAAGLRPDLIVGTSAGALNGVLCADDPGSAVARLTRVWTSCRRSSVIGDSRLRVARNLLGGHYMFRNERLATLFENEIGARRFDDLVLPFACVATDIGTGDPAVLRDGELIPALLATCAIPGVFPLVRLGERLLADGGYVANVPVRQAIDLGAASLVVFDGRPRIVRDQPKDVRGSMTAAFAAALKQQHDNDLAHAATIMPVLRPPGQPASHVKGFDFTRTEAIIEDARAAASTYFAASTRDRAMSTSSSSTARWAERTADSAES